MNAPNFNRIEALDALRGFAMLWIIGADVIVHRLAMATELNWVDVASSELRHADWSGLNAYDLVFPVFMFVSGVALALSYAGARSRGVDDARFLLKTARRALILVALGVVYNFGWDVSPERFRLPSVLGQIGLALLFAAVFVVGSRSLVRPIAAALGIALAVTVLQLGVTVPGGEAGDLTAAGSINGWLDRALLPGRLHGGSYDPEGILAVFSAATITLAGAAVGRWLFVDSPGPVSPRRLVAATAAGAVLIAAGFALAPVYPVIKKLWTVSFDIVAIGWSLALLGLFVLIIDVWRWRWPVRVFSPIGRNAIAIYMAARFLLYPLYAPLDQLAQAFGHWPVVAALAGLILLQWYVLAWLHRRERYLTI